MWIDREKHSILEEYSEGEKMHISIFLLTTKQKRLLSIIC